MRKSINLGGGVRLNLGRRGIGISAGVRGLRYSVNSSGRVTRTVSVPGTGLSHVSSRGGGRRGEAARRVSAPPGRPKPGLLAPKYEKEFHRGVESLLAGDLAAATQHFVAASYADDKGRTLGDELMVGLTAVSGGHHAAAVPYLERVVADERELPDELLLKYASDAVLAIDVTENVRVHVGMDSLAAVLALVECYQEVGRSDEAIGLLQQLVTVEPSPELTLSLCELLEDAGAWDELVELAAGVENVDDVTFAIRLHQARALEAIGQPEAALEVYRALLRTKKRDPELLKAARYGRGRLLVRTGKVAQGRKDLATLFAEDPGYLDVRELLAATQRG